MLRELWENDVNCGMAGRAMKIRPISAHTPVRSQDTLAVNQRTALLSTERSATGRIAQDLGLGARGSGFGARDSIVLRATSVNPQSTSSTSPGNRAAAG